MTPRTGDLITAFTYGALVGFLVGMLLLVMVAPI